MKKATKKEIIERVNKIFDLLLKGYNTHDILQYVADKSGWGVKDRSVFYYIKKANKLFEKSAEVKRNEWLGKTINRYNLLFAKAFVEKDYMTCTQIQDKLAEVLKLKIQQVDLTSGGKPIPILGDINVSVDDSNKENPTT
jgi:hypothetical protein